MFQPFARDLAKRKRRPALYPPPQTGLADALEQLCAGATVEPQRDVMRAAISSPCLTMSGMPVPM